MFKTMMDYFCFCTRAEDDKQATQNVNIDTNNNITPASRNNGQKETDMQIKQVSKDVSSRGSNLYKGKQGNKKNNQFIDLKKTPTFGEKKGSNQNEKNKKSINIRITNINNNIQNLTTQQVEQKQALENIQISSNTNNKKSPQDITLKNTKDIQKKSISNSVSDNSKNAEYNINYLVEQIIGEPRKEVSESDDDE